MTPAELERAYWYEQLMRRTLGDGIRKIRRDFQMRWGSFWKCSQCGARLEAWRLLDDGETGQSE